MIRITAKKNRFRRCGEEFTKEPRTFSDDYFTEEELRILKEEPMLIVEIIPKAQANALTEK